MVAGVREGEGTIVASSSACQRSRHLCDSFAASTELQSLLIEDVLESEEERRSQNTLGDLRTDACVLLASYSRHDLYRNLPL